jgi:site-specific DNA-cytosine methylase
MHEHPTFGSLFSGIDGIGLGLERAGWTPRWQVEIEPFPSRILAVRWPDVPRYGDIREIDWSLVEPVDLIGRDRNRRPQLAALGNAVVPDLVESIGRQLIEGLSQGHQSR